MDKHGERGTDQGMINLGVIITPMLDMAFQVLAFFIMTYHPSALETYLGGELLPPAGAVKGDGIAENPAFTELEFGESLGVQIKAVAAGREENDRQEGEPQQLLLKLPHEAEAREIANATVSFEVGLQRLEKELRRFLLLQALGQTRVKLEGDRHLKHMYTIMVYDACKAAGCHDIAFVAPARDGAQK